MGRVLRHAPGAGTARPRSGPPQPRHRTPLRIGRALPYVLNGLLISAFMLTAAALLLGLRIPLGALPGLAEVLLAAAPGCSASGLALGALGLRLRDVFLISNVAGSVLLLPTGANVPRAGLPEGMRLAGDVLPLTHAMEAAGRGLRAAASTGDRSGRSRWSERGTRCSPCCSWPSSSAAAAAARPLTSCDGPGTPGRCALFTRGSRQRRPGVAASPMIGPYDGLGRYDRV
ncbi:ABC transporter permease [Streptomyces sp. NPDC059513]|uniref:ABC transporter permease n=1 Tax=unclassified Streptomyces TaxID=2593676 RepID=UPI0036CD7E7F